MQSTPGASLASLQVSDEKLQSENQTLKQQVVTLQTQLAELQKKYDDNKADYVLLENQLKALHVHDPE